MHAFNSIDLSETSQLTKVHQIKENSGGTSKSYSIPLRKILR